MGWTLAFWTAFATLVTVYLGYPLALLLARTRRRIAPAAPPAILPSVTVLVPAYDEEAVIGAKVRNLLDLDYSPGRLEALIISDGSTDGTCDAARRAIEEAPHQRRDRIRLLENELRVGKTTALSRSVDQARGDILVFTDANAMYGRDTVRRLVEPFADPEVGLVCGRLRYVSSGSGASGEALYWRYEDALKRWEGDLGRLLVANGSIYAIRRDLFEPMPGEVADDFVLPLVVHHRGYRLLYAPRAVAEERLPAHAAEDFRSKARIVTRGLEALLHYRRRVLESGHRRLVQYALHKVLRWLAPLLLLTLLCASIAARGDALIGLALWIQGIFYALAALGLALGGRATAPLRLPAHFCLVNAAALKGLVDFALRRRRALWEKSQSTRAIGEPPG